MFLERIGRVELRAFATGWKPAGRPLSNLPAFFSQQLQDHFHPILHQDPDDIA